LTTNQSTKESKEPQEPTEGPEPPNKKRAADLWSYEILLITFRAFLLPAIKRIGRKIRKIFKFICLRYTKWLATHQPEN
jgi:hypothetical protein